MKAAMYCDTSALAKLVLGEKESGSLKSVIDSSDCQLASSVISEIELFRACRRHSVKLVETATQVLARVILLPLTTPMIVKAGEVAPPDLRSLDAIHLATALEILDDLDCLVTYDKRLAAASEYAGLRVRSPGAV